MCRFGGIHTTADARLPGLLPHRSKLYGSYEACSLYGGWYQASVTPKARVHVVKQPTSSALPRQTQQQSSSSSSYAALSFPSGVDTERLNRWRGEPAQEWKLSDGAML